MSSPTFTPYLPLDSATKVEAFVDALYGAGLEHGGRTQARSLSNLLSRIGLAATAAYYDHADESVYAMSIKDLRHNTTNPIPVNGINHFISTVLAIRRESS